MVRGGTHQFVYSDKCTISVERRTLPGETQEQVLRDLSEILTGLADEDPKFSATIRTVMTRNPYEISQDAGIVKITKTAAAHVSGKSPSYVGHHWWEDSA